MGENTITAQLVWDDDVNTSALLTAGTHTYKVKLDITGTESTFPDYDDPDGNFLITVQVEKEKLDFSDVAFQNATRYTGLNNPDFRVIGMPEGTTITKTEYCKAGESDWTTEKPAEASADDAANYKVRITFTYDDSKYLLDTIPPELQPDAAYELAAGAAGEGTITGDYVVRALTADDLTVTAKSGLVYNKNSQKTVTVSGIPGEAKISVTWMENGETKTETIDSASLSSYDVAGITNAGSYEITVKVEHSGFNGGFVEKTVTGTIAKQTVTTPKANTGLQPYTPTKEQTGVPDSTTPEIYTVSGNKQINAGTHTAKAILEDSSNYKWSSGDPAESGKVEITYTIPRRQLQKPTLVQDRYPFENRPIMPLQRNNGELEGKFAADGELTAYWRAYGEAYVAYTATQAQMTDAGKYTITITLNNSADVKDYAWADGTDDSFTLEWEITKKQIDAPTVTVSSAVYTGEAYDAAAKIQLASHSGNSDGILTLGSDHTYYTSSTTPTPMADTPVNAGTYYVEVDFAYEPGLKPDNYQIIGNTRKSFTINKATAQLSFEDPAQTATYTAVGTPLQLATVSGLVPADESKLPQIAPSIRYTYRYSNDPNPNWGSIEPVAIEAPTNHTFTEVGYYQITASRGSDAVSNNYTAADATYNLTINSADNQSITLTPDQADRWTEASDSTPANYTITFGDAATFTVTGNAALDDAPITYAVTEGQDVLALNGNNQSGTMKILKAGEATVTVTAAKTANVAAASVTYTVTVNKATPTVTVVMPEGGSDDNTYGYTGTALAFSAAVKGPGGVTEPVTDGKISYKYYADQAGQTELPSQPTGVGTYWVEAIYSGDDNYTEARSAPVKVTISAAVLDVTVNDAYKDTYDGQSHAAASGLTVKGNGQDITGSATITYATKQDGSYTPTMPQFKDAGTYTVYYKVTADNYAEKAGSFTVAISPKALTVSGVPASFEKVYDGQANITTALTGIKVDTDVAGETIRVSASGTYDNENVGKSKKVTLTLTLDGVTEWGNYSYNGTPLAEGTLTLTETTGKITPKEITVTGVDAVDRDYDGTSTVALTGTPKTEGKMDSDDLTLTLAPGATGTADDKNASDSPKTVTVDNSVITLGGTDAGNYQVTAVVTDAASNEINVMINKAAVTLSVEGAVNGTVTKGYTGRPIVLTAEITDNVFDQALEQGDVEFTFKQNGIEAHPITVGSYDVTVALRSGAEANYSNFDIQPGSCTLTITDAALTVDVKDYSGTYTGQSHELTKGWTFESSTGNTVSDPEVSFALKQAGESQNPREDGSWISGDAIKNVSQSGDYWYKVEYESHTAYYSADTVKIAIAPAKLTLSSNLTASKEYDGKDAAAVADPQLSGQQNGENVTVTDVSAAYDNKDVGTGKAITVTYTVTFGTGVDAGNDTADGQVSKAGQTWTVAVETAGGVITAKPVTVDIQDQDAVYDGAPAELKGDAWKVTDGEFYGSDGVTIALTADDAKDAGTHGITGTVSGAGKGNYNVTFQPGTLTIRERPVTLQIGGAEGVYGDDPVKPSDLLTDVSSGPDTGLVGSDEASGFLHLVTIQAGKTSNVGSYNIIGTDGKSGNYDVTFRSGTYTVSKRPVTVTIDDQQSLYGQKIAQPTWSVTSGSMANGDNLGITLETTAVKGSNVGAYAISEQSRNDAVAANYEVTVKGETPFDGNDDQATYTIGKADLTIAFTNATANASIGGSVDNPLKFTNASNSNELLAGKPDDVVVECTSDNESIATVDQDTGAVTIISAGDVTITATVIDGGQNFNAGSTASYELRIATAGQGIQVNVQPRTLTYNGTAQEFVTSAVLFPTDRTVTIEYSLDGQVYSAGIPTGINAGSYTVYWKASANGYTAVSGSVPVSIAKANPSTGFSRSNVQTIYEEGKVYDSTQFTTLLKATDYTGMITYLSNDTQVARVNNNDLANISINSTGSATISAVFGETENYKAQTVSFTLTVTDSATTIQYTAADYEVEYDGQAHGAKITVDSPSTCTILYSDDGETSYGLTESPTITDVGTLTIYYQISSPGYTSVSGTQTVTVEPKPITPTMVSGIADSYTYTGQQITVDNTLTVTDGSTLLERDTDYTVEYGANTEVGMNGYVKITGIGNYAGTVEEHFEITAVEASYLSASLDRHFGYYGDSSTNNATVTVMHGGHAVTDGVSVTVNGPDCTVSGRTITFNAVGVYPIEVQVTGTHTGSFTLHYTLLPRDSGGDFEIGGLTDSVVTYDGQNHAFTPTVSDTDGTPLTDSDYELTYSYIPFSGTEINSEPYDPNTTEMIEAGLYTITVTGIGNYTGTILVDYTILSDPAEPVTGFELTVSPDEWTYTATPTVTIAVTHDGSPISDYTLSVEKDGKIVASGDAAAAIAALVEPGVYTITASGTGAYSGSSDTATVTIHKIQPQLSITATPSSLSGGGTVKLTISGSELPVGTDLKTLLGVSTANGTQVDLTKLTWTEAAGAYTAELTLANANETYTFTLAYLGDDHYAGAQDTAVVVTAQQTSGGGGGGGTLSPEEPNDGIADPDDTGVSN